MKKNRGIIIALIIFESIVLVLCILAYYHFTNNTQIIEQKKTEITEKEVIFQTSNYPKVDAALNMQNLANAFICNFTGERIDVSRLDYTDSQSVYKRLVDGNVDLVISQEPTQEEINYASQKGLELEYIPIVKDAFVFYVNNNNPVDNLSLEEIKKIYSSRIMKWSEVGGNDANIRAFQRTENNENQKGMLKLIMNDTEISSPIMKEKSSIEDIETNIISDFDNEIDSLGYSYYYYAKMVYDEFNSETIDGVKLIKINGIKPNYENIQNDTYPIITNYYVTIRKNEEAEGSVRRLRDAMLSSSGKLVAKEAGYVPTK